ncbi:cyanate hydratase-like isoform X2 [Brevipalpus obovatus]|uniref:cyanate hydratase-like isoform X2 n=1 Tax=Brevipalpus obovatus TaxID=246614 RepID=UPI003D9EB2CB
MKLLPSLRSCSNIRDVYVKTRVLQRESELNHLKVLKARKGITYAQLAQELGCNKVWIASVFCGQNPCDKKTAEKLLKLLDDNGEVSHISQIPIRGNMELTSDPVDYRNWYQSMAQAFEN